MNNPSITYKNLPNIRFRSISTFHRKMMSNGTKSLSNCQNNLVKVNEIIGELTQKLSMQDEVIEKYQAKIKRMKEDGKIDHQNYDSFKRECQDSKNRLRSKTVALKHNFTGQIESKSKEILELSKLLESKEKGLSEKDQQILNLEVSIVKLKEEGQYLYSKDQCQEECQNKVKYINESWQNWEKENCHPNNNKKKEETTTSTDYSVFLENDAFTPSNNNQNQTVSNQELPQNLEIINQDQNLTKVNLKICQNNYEIMRSNYSKLQIENNNLQNRIVKQQNQLIIMTAVFIIFLSIIGFCLLFNRFSKKFRKMSVSRKTTSKKSSMHRKSETTDSNATHHSFIHH